MPTPIAGRGCKMSSSQNTIKDLAMSGRRCTIQRSITSLVSSAKHAALTSILKEISKNLQHQNKMPLSRFIRIIIFQRQQLTNAELPASIQELSSRFLDTTMENSSTTNQKCQNGSSSWHATKNSPTNMLISFG